MGLWNLVNPMRPESVFRVMTETLAYLYHPLPRKGIDGVSIELAELCGLHELSTQETNPYFSVAHGLSRLLEAPKGAASQGAVILVSRHMRNEFGALLENKDSGALLPLSLWYTRARESKWWMGIRARYELPAVCTYLRRYHSENGIIQGLIPGTV